MESGDILDSQLDASTEYDADHAAKYGRLHFTAGASAWVSDTNNLNQWLRIDLLNKGTKVTGVATQGRSTGDNHWVSSYKLSYTDDSESYQFYQEQGENIDKVLTLYSCSN